VEEVVTAAWSRRLLLIVMFAYAVLPVAWLVRLSVTPEIEIHRWPPTVLPSQLTAAHYGEILGAPSFWIQLTNSLVVCLVATLVALTLGALGAYGLARYRFRWRDALLTACLVLHLAPGAASMAAVYRGAEVLHAFNSLLFIALLKAGGVTLVIWILVAAFQGVPVNLEQAAHLDGWRPRQVLRRVTLPLAGRGLFTAGLLLFIQAWNTFFLPFLLLEDPAKMTLTVGLYRYFSEHGFAPGHVAAFTVISILPTLALFLAFRRRIWSRFAT
jgi:ABC-type glycerol-3-phosphate transport system permease component